MPEYEFKTTFWSDFTIADAFGVDAVRDTYNRAFNEWKTNIEYITELVMVLNWKSFAWAEKGDDEMMSLYCDLYYEASGYCLDTLKDEELNYYLEVTN